jgi:peptide/nickel transport system substrate-binding protein
MEPKKLYYMVVVIVLVIAAFVAGYYLKPVPTPTPPSPHPEVLTYAINDEPTTWDPSASYSVELSYLANIYETLLKVNAPGSKERFTPVLATSWESSDDGLVWTFHLRQGVKFHDGNPFNAQAVKYSVERTKNMGLGAAYMWGAVENITVVDTYTVKFELSYAAPLDFMVASGYAAWMMSPESAEKGTEWFNQGHDAGTGPYMLESYKPGEEVVLTKFADYWGGWDRPEGHYSKIVCKIVQEPLTQRLMLESGEAQLAMRIPLEAIMEVDASPYTKAIIGPSFMNYAAHLNTQRPPLDNKLVRQAISYAIPYGDIVIVGYASMATQARGPLPVGQFGHNDTLFQYSYNLTKAKELLAEAGYPDGINRTLVLTYASENPAYPRYVSLIKENLAEIGINIDVQPMLWPAQWARGKGPEEDRQDIFLLLWWPDYGDPYGTLYSMWHSEDKPFFNMAYYKNPEFDKLIDDAYKVTSTDPGKALELYFEAEQILIEDAPSVFLVDVLEGKYMREALQGFVVNPYYPRVVFFYDLYWRE